MPAGEKQKTNKGRGANSRQAREKSCRDSWKKQYYGKRQPGGKRGRPTLVPHHLYIFICCQKQDYDNNTKKHRDRGIEQQYHPKESE